MKSYIGLFCLLLCALSISNTISVLPRTSCLNTGSIFQPVIPCECKSYSYRTHINVNGCHWNACELVMTITHTDSQEYTYCCQCTSVRQGPHTELLAVVGTDFIGRTPITEPTVESLKVNLNHGLDLDDSVCIQMDALATLRHHSNCLMWATSDSTSSRVRILKFVSSTLKPPRKTLMV